VLELLQRNAEVSIPFAVSSLGYGFLLEQPGGRARRVRPFDHALVAEAAQQLDYWVSAGSPAELLRKLRRGHWPRPRVPVLGQRLLAVRLR